MIFDVYTKEHLLAAVKRAIDLFKYKYHYDQCRHNAFDGAIDVADVARAWAQEFYRMFNKNFIDAEIV